MLRWTRVQSTVKGIFLVPRECEGRSSWWLEGPPSIPSFKDVHWAPVVWPARRPQQDTARNETGKVFDSEELTRYWGWSDSEQVNRHDDFSPLGQCPEETKPPSCEAQGALAAWTR